MCYPLAFRILLEAYFEGTKPRKRGVLSRLTRAVVLDGEALPALVEALRSYAEERSLEVLLQIAESLDSETHKLHWKQEDYRQMMVNVIRYYSAAASLLKEFQMRRERDSKEVACLDEPNPWTKPRIRKELIRVFRANKCVRKATAARLMITPEHLRRRILPRYRINEEEERKRWIEEALFDCGGRIKETAQRLGVSCQTLKKRIRRYGLEGAFPQRERSNGFVDRIPVAQTFLTMYRGTLETTAKDPKCRKFCLKFFRNVERFLRGEFESERERRETARLLRLSAECNLLRIQVLYEDLFGQQIPFDITTATRYKFCNRLLKTLSKKIPHAKGGTTTHTSLGGPKIEDLLLSLKVWAMRHWGEPPLHFKAYRRKMREAQMVEEKPPRLSYAGGNYSGG